MSKEKTTESVPVEYKEGKDEWGMANFFSRMTQWWATSLIVTMSRRQIQDGELWKLSESQMATNVLTKYKSQWEKELLLPIHDRSFKRAMIRASWVDIIIVLLQACVVNALTITSSSFFITNILRCLADLSITQGEGLGYAFGFGACEVIRALVNNYQWNTSTTVGMNIRSATQTLMYEKILRLRYSAGSPGETVNMVSSDCQRLCDMATWGIYVIATPVILIGIIAVMIVLIGPAVLYGFIFMFAMVPIQVRLFFVFNVIPIHNFSSDFITGLMKHINYISSSVLLWKSILQVSSKVLQNLRQENSSNE
jgi:hypothetical protein